MLKQATWTVYQSGWLLCIGDGLIFIWPASLLQQRKWGCRDLQHDREHHMEVRVGIIGDEIVDWGSLSKLSRISH